MNNLSDGQLLRKYAEQHSEAAFAELVRRHVDLVYSAALRLVCATHAAEDVTQAVFVALAQNASQLARHPVLSGWLHCTARNLAAKAVRSDVRRRAREQEAATMNALRAEESDVSWDLIAPQLDAALGELDGPERDALLLRYFEKKSAREMASLLGVSDDAAQKRVSRAVEHLRGFFAKRGISVGAGGLVVVISANAVQAAPAGLTAAVCTAATLAGSTIAATSTTTFITKAITMTTLQKTLVTATIAVLAGAGIYEARQASQLRNEVQTLQQRQAPLKEQMERLQTSFADATNRLADLLAENARLKSNPNQNELLKLRGEVTRLHAESQELALLKAAASARTNDPSETAMRNWVSHAQELRQRIEQMPDAQIPEFKFLMPADWLDVAKDASLETDDDIHNAVSMLKANAKDRFAGLVRNALKKYVEASNGELPTAMSQLTQFFPTPVDDAVLQRYAIIQSGQINNLAETDRNFRVISEKPIAPGSGRPIVQIGTDGFIRIGQ